MNTVHGSIPPSLVTCMRALVFLNIGRNQLHGPIPGNIQWLKALQYFMLNKNKLDGRLPDWLVHLESLRDFQGQNNRFEGSLPGCGKELHNLGLYSNRISGSVPEHFSGEHPRLLVFFADHNKIAGSIPAALSSMRALRQIGISSNSLTGSLPVSLMTMARLQLLQGEENRFRGSMPGFIQRMPDLEVLSLSGNQLSGNFALLLGSAHPRLERLLLDRNNIRGTIPEAIVSVERFLALTLGNNKLIGSIPLGIYLLQILRLAGNYLSGSLPNHLHAGGDCRLVELALDENLLRGSIPDGVLQMRVLSSIELTRNEVSGSLPPLPESVGVVCFSLNRFHGTLPDGLEKLLALTVLDLSSNTLSGSIPTRISSLSLLLRLLLNNNRLAGTLPRSLASLRELYCLNFDEAGLSGTIPAALCSLSAIGLVDGKNNGFEGTLPSCLGGLMRLILWSMSGDVQKSKLHGSLPTSFARIKAITSFIAPHQHLEGEIPPFAATLLVLALHENALVRLSRLRWKVSAVVLLHRNRLSCKLPTDNVSKVAMALVALGNHLTRPKSEGFPAWVSPMEREGLFWCQHNAGMWVVGRVLAGCSALVLAVSMQVGCHRLVALTNRWHAALGCHGIFASLTTGLFSFMASQVLGGHLLLMLVASCSYYLCPEALAQWSACLFHQSFVVQATVASLWSRFCSEAQQRFWVSVAPSRAKAFKKVQGCLLWTCWLLLVIVLSALVVTDVAAKCIPSFLPLDGYWVCHFDIASGLVQGILSGVLLPFLADLVSKRSTVRKSALICTAAMLSTFLLPTIVVLYLDGACMRRWTSWWSPCTQGKSDTRVFEIVVNVGDIEKRVIMHQEDVCVPKRHFSLASCMRSIALKLQNLMLSKLATGAFAIPAGRLVAARYYKSIDSVVVKLALLLELGMLLGPALPLTISLLCTGVLTERLLAAVAWDAGVLKPLFKPGDVRLAAAATGVCSLVFYGCFFSEDALASMFFFFEFGLLLGGGSLLQMLLVGKVQTPNDTDDP